jgi:cell division protein FtsN
MPRDYARYVNKPKRPLVERGWRKRLLLVGFLVLLLGGGAFGFYVYQHQKGEDATHSVGLWVKQVKALFIKTPEEQEALKLTVDHSKAVSDKQDAEIQFSFYTNLATMQVSAPQAPSPQTLVENKSNPILVKKPIAEAAVPEAAVPTASRATVVADERYLLQIAAFKNPTAAGEMRITLLLAGFEVEIVKAMHNGQQLYQLQQGPFSTVAEVKAMQRELKKKDIESVIVKKIT